MQTLVERRTQVALAAADAEAKHACFALPLLAVGRNQGRMRRAVTRSLAGAASA